MKHSRNSPASLCARRVKEEAREKVRHQAGALHNTGRKKRENAEDAVRLLHSYAVHTHLRGREKLPTPESPLLLPAKPSPRGTTTMSKMVSTIFIDFSRAYILHDKHGSSKNTRRYLCHLYIYYLTSSTNEDR
jgi:hypothetical protein